MRVGRLYLVELGLSLFVGGEQAQLLGPLHHDLVVDELAQDAQPQALRLFLGGRLRRAGRLVGVVLVHFRAQDLLAVHVGHHVAGGLLFVAGGQGEQQGQRAGQGQREATESRQVQHMVVICPGEVPGYR